MSEWLPLVAPIWIASALVAAAVAQSKGAPNVLTWGLLGLLFGPLGAIASLFGAKPRPRG